MDMKPIRPGITLAFDAKAKDQGEIPSPLKGLVLAADHPVDVAAVDLLEGSLRYYRLELSDILLGDRLRAHFDVHFLGHTYPVATRYDRQQLDIQDRQLRAFGDEPLAAWNLIQLRSAMYFIDHASPKGRAVDLQTIESFKKSPTQFYRLMHEPAIQTRPN